MAAFYIVLQEKIPGVDAVGLEGRALSRHSAKMESLAKAGGVTPLLKFFSATETELDALLEDHVIPNQAASEVKEAWFPAREGLRTVDTLLKVLSAQSAPENSTLVQELMEFRRVLESAETQNVRWHLGIDY